MASVFTKIINGELPSYKIYEDDDCFAFLALDQIHPGHTLVVPKAEVDHFIDVPEPAYTAVFQAAKKIGKAIHRATGCARVGAMIVGYEVPHFHLHLIPTQGMGDFDFKKARRLPDEEMKAAQDGILAALES